MSSPLGRRLMSTFAWAPTLAREVGIALSALAVASCLVVGILASLRGPTTAPVERTGAALATHLANLASREGLDGATSVQSGSSTSPSIRLKAATETVLAIPSVVYVRMAGAGRSAVLVRGGIPWKSDAPMRPPWELTTGPLHPDGPPRVDRFEWGNVPLVDASVRVKSPVDDTAITVQVGLENAPPGGPIRECVLGMMIISGLAAVLALRLRWTTRLLAPLTEAFRRLADGGDPEPLDVTGLSRADRGLVDPDTAAPDVENEVILLARCHQKLTRALRTWTDQALAIARDDLGAAVLDAEAAGALGQALARTTANLRGLVDQIRTITDGEAVPGVRSSPGKRGISHACAGMLETLRRLERSARAAAAGDLTSPDLCVELTGEVGAAFSRVVSSFRDLLEHLIDTATRLDDATSRVGTLCAAQLKASAHQASAVNETSTSIEEMDATICQIAEIASQVLAVASESVTAAEQGKTAVEGVVQAIHDIRSYNELGLRLVNDLGKRSHKISEISRIINEIAGQTKLLSLNAAIEAARAGESGRGFAIVATEIRKLTDSVVRSTREIERVIGDILSMVAQVVESASAGQSRVEAVVERAEKTGSSLRQILEMARRTAEFSRHISVATQQQQSGSDQIVSAAREMVAHCTWTADNGREITRASAELGEATSAVNSLLARFVIDRSVGQKTQRTPGIDDDPRWPRGVPGAAGRHGTPVEPGPRTMRQR